ncbi:MAG TPA: DUF5818 domain-containing protein [Candidatus Limnocylindrales bacterium]|nr:DUF5818 domain-containing protein [Candidatus Limnocylindrales bacterium]
MKKLIPMLALAAMSAMAADWTGYIVDKNCAGKKEMWGDEACAQSCIKRGAPAVFVTADGKIYQVSDQAKAKEMAGKKVTLTGKMKGDTITVENIKAAE